MENILWPLFKGDGKMIRDITRNQWNTMTAEQMAGWMVWAMTQGAEAPLPVNPPDMDAFSG